MEAGELGVLFEPGGPAFLEWRALAVAGEHGPEVGAGDTQLGGGMGDAREAGFEGLVRGTVDELGIVVALAAFLEADKTEVLIERGVECDGIDGNHDGLMALKFGELRMALEPGIPPGEQRRALAFSGEDAVEVAAMDAEFVGGNRGAWKTDVRAG